MALESSASVRAQLITAKSVCFLGEDGCLFLSAGELPPRSLWLAPQAHRWEQFVVAASGDNSVTLFNEHFKTFISADSDSIVQVDAVRGDAQKWKVLGRGSVSLMNVASRKFIDAHLKLSPHGALWTPMLSQPRGDGAWRTEPLLLDVAGYVPPPSTGPVDVGAEARAARQLLTQLVRRQRVIEKMLLPLAATMLKVNKGVTYASLRALGYPDVSELKAAGLGREQLVAAGFDGVALLDMGFKLPTTRAELRAINFDFASIKSLGFSARSFFDAGITSPRDLMVGAGFAAGDLFSSRISPRELKRAGFTLRQLIGSGFTVGDLCEVEFSDLSCQRIVSRGAWDLDECVYFGFAQKRQTA